MKHFKIYLIGIVALIFFGSCEKDANVKLPKTEPKLVINSFLSPQDTVIVIWVKQSRPIFESYDVTTSDVIPNATVSLTDGTTSINVPFNSGVTGEGGYYTIHSALYPIVEGKTYTVNVSTPDGKSASASTMVPSYFNANFSGTVNTNTLTSQFEGTETQYRIPYSFNDIAGSGDKYRVSIVRMLHTAFGDTVYQYWGEDYIDDDGKDAQVISQTFEYSEYSFSGGGAQDSVIGHDLYLYHVNSDYYSYHKSIRNSYIDSGDPFAEPTLVYTNITGGLGAFCAFNYLAKVEIR